MRRLVILLTLLLLPSLVLGAVACGDEEEAEQSPTPTLAPTATSVATPTQAPTRTARPTATPIPTPTQAPAPGMKHFSDEGVSFDYAKEWHEVGFTWEPGYEWGVCFSGGTGDEPGISVLRYALEDQTLLEFALSSQDIGYGTDYDTSTPVETTINGRAAYAYTYSGSKNGVSVQGDTVIVTDGVSAYWLDGFATQADYLENKDEFQRTFESFIIE